MPIKRYTLDGKDIHSLADLYGRLSILMELPVHFGNNLDALWDVLSTDIGGPFEIVWRHADDSKRSMRKDFNRTVKLLRELEKARDDFKFRIEP